MKLDVVHYFLEYEMSDRELRSVSKHPQNPVFLIKAHPEEGDGVLVMAHTNKSWFGLQKELEKAIKGTTIKMAGEPEEKETI